MKRTCCLLILCLLLVSCAGANEVIRVCPDLPPFTESQSDVTEEAYALVDWMIFVRYNGRSYTRDFSEPTVIPEDQIGELLGTVESKPPSRHRTPREPARGTATLPEGQPNYSAGIK